MLVLLQFVHLLLHFPAHKKCRPCHTSIHCLQATTQEVHIEDFAHDEVLLMLQWMYGRLQSIPENHAQASLNMFAHGCLCWTTLCF